MNLNKEFLSEIISYLISKGVTLTDVLDTFNEHFNNEIKCEHEKQSEVRKPITDIDLLLCGRSVEESSTPCQKVEKNAENTEKPVSKSWIDYPKNIKNHGNGVSPARKALFDVINGKTVIEHLKENGITYSNFDNRIRKKWSVADACTTPLASWGKGKRKRVIEEPEEHKAVIIPDTNVISLEPEKITGTKVTTAIIDDIIPAENTAENVTIEPQTKTDTDTRVNDTNANSDAKNSESERIEQLTDKTVRDIVTGKNKEKKKPENKKDYAVSDLCFKLNITTHELREMINNGDFPQPDCDKKWSVKLLKKEGII